jgi:endonuclease I
MKKYIFLILLAVGSMLFAQEPNGYYYSANGKTNNQLRLALHDVIKNHYDVGYGSLWTVYQASEFTSEGKVWDIYSACTWNVGQKHCGSYSSVCDCINREHSIPQSWFNEASPMRSDAFHVYPTDGKVNGQRSNFPFGECSNGTSLGGNALGKLGNSTFSGYSGTVFEPDNEYKGDLARTYFYMATRYSDKCNNWGNGVFGTEKNGLTVYAVNLFLKWHRNDPVSQKEINRNNAIYGHQQNRNPFIDHPELAEYIWGNKAGVEWHIITDVEEIDFFKVKIYPNPAKNFISIEANDYFQEFDYQIVSISGKILTSGKTSVNQQINISNFSNGIYFVKIFTEKYNFIEKLLKN